MELRLARRFTRAKLAAQSGVSAVHIKLIENGTNPVTGKPVQPSAKVLRQLADALADHESERATDIYLTLAEAAGQLPSRERIARWAESTPPDISEEGLWQTELGLRMLRALRRLPRDSQQALLTIAERMPPPPDDPGASA